MFGKVSSSTRCASPWCRGGPGAGRPGHWVILRLAALLAAWLAALLAVLALLACFVLLGLLLCLLCLLCWLASFCLVCLLCFLLLALLALLLASCFLLALLALLLASCLRMHQNHNTHVRSHQRTQVHTTIFHFRTQQRKIMTIMFVCSPSKQLNKGNLLNNHLKDAHEL